MLQSLRYAAACFFLLPVTAAYAADAEVRLSSIGYVPTEAKRATVLGSTSGEFVVRRVGDESEALSGQLEPRGSAGIADFSALLEEGSFVLEVPGVGRSVPFPIDVHAYVEPYRAAMLGFYAWRSGVDVTLSHDGQTWSHAAGHLQDAYLDFVGQPGVRADGTGGWYDAGDYGKYTVNSAVTMGLLLRAWEDFRSRLEPIPLQIPEADGALPDYLDELRFQLDWMLKMQFGDGSVSHKLTPIDFAGFIQPAEDTSPRYFSPWGSAATAGFAATMARAARVFGEFDAPFAERLLGSAQQAYDFLTAHPGNHAADLSNYEHAQYQTDDADDRVWAAAEIWETTGAEEALSDFEARVAALEDRVPVDWDWGDQSNLGVFTYLLSKREGRNPSLVSELRAALLATADEHVELAAASEYGRGLDAVYWGSNGTVARICSTLRIADELSSREAYLATCADQVAHLFGRNEYGRSQVTGVGIDPPLFPHDRRSASDAVEPPYPGYLVGGASRPGNWVDERASYETNEIAINWQGALVYALAGFVTAPPPAEGGAAGAGVPPATGGASSTGGEGTNHAGNGGEPSSAGGGTSAPTNGGDAAPAPGDSGKENGGCGCRAGGSGEGTGAWVLVGLVAAAVIGKRCVR